MSLLIHILEGVFVFVAALMMLIILMQRPKSEGLGAAFGGGVTENIFGAQTTNVLTKVTGWLAAIFFLLTFFLSILYARKANRSSNLTRDVIAGSTPVPAASATPVPGVSISPGPAASGTVAASPAAGGTTTPAAPVTNSPAASTSPAPSAATSVAPATTPAISPAPATSPKASAAASVAASPKP
jgi:preprotein translocase subunit SecG